MPERPHASSDAVRRRFAEQRREGTGPEMELRRALHARGLRYRVAYPVPGLQRRSIDVAFLGPRVAVFVDGCFWHGCPQHFVPPKANAQWWADKIERNRARDQETVRHLATQGWRSIRLWEHEPVEEMSAAVTLLLEGDRPCTGPW